MDQEEMMVLLERMVILDLLDLLGQMVKRDPMEKQVQLGLLDLTVIKDTG